MICIVLYSFLPYHGLSTSPFSEFSADLRSSLPEQHEDTEKDVEVGVHETRNDGVHEVLFGVPENSQGFMEILIGTNVIHDDESNPIKKQRNHFTCINIERIRVCFRHYFLRHGACTRQFGRVHMK